MSKIRRTMFMLWCKDCRGPDWDTVCSTKKMAEDFLRSDHDNRVVEVEVIVETLDTSERT